MRCFSIPKGWTGLELKWRGMNEIFRGTYLHVSEEHWGCERRGPTRRIISSDCRAARSGDCLGVFPSQMDWNRPGGGNDDEG